MARSAFEKPVRYRLMLVCNETGERKPSLLKGADQLSKREANYVIKNAKPSAAFHYEAERIQ